MTKTDDMILINDHNEYLSTEGVSLEWILPPTAGGAEELSLWLKKNKTNHRNNHMRRNTIKTDDFTRLE